jgi:hypothetical protein
MAKYLFFLKYIKWVHAYVFDATKTDSSTFKLFGFQIV